MQLEAAHAVRPLTVATVFSPTESHRRACVDKIRRQIGIEARAVSSAAEAIEDVDIIITATNSRTPVFDGNLLKPGMHITSMSNPHAPGDRQHDDAPGQTRSSLPLKRPSASMKAMFSELCVTKQFPGIACMKLRIFSWTGFRVVQMTGKSLCISCKEQVS
jgi:alanine dehydrogenase